MKDGKYNDFRLIDVTRAGISRKASLDHKEEGVAEVYAATDLKLKRPVAVKVLHPDLVVSHTLIERFLREAQAVAKLRHRRP